MSYILDALRKSEQERTQGSVPNVHAMHSLGTPISKKRSSWPYIVILLCVVNALILWMWLKPGAEERAAEKVAEQGAERQSAVVDSAITKSVQTPLKPAPESAPVPDRIVSEEGRPSVEQQVIDQRVTEPPPVATANDSAAVPRKGKVIIAAAPLTDEDGILLDTQVTTDMAQGVAQSPVSQPPAPADAAEEVAIVNAPGSATTDTIETAGEEYIQPVTELATSLQRKIPKLSYAGHVFSDNPARRSVLINGRKLREGHVVEGELVLEEIRLGYSVFSFQGQRFRIDMLRDWPFE